MCLVYFASDLKRMFRAHTLRESLCSTYILSCTCFNVKFVQSFSTNSLNVYCFKCVLFNIIPVHYHRAYSVHVYFTVFRSEMTIPNNNIKYYKIFIPTELFNSRSYLCTVSSKMFSSISTTTVDLSQSRFIRYFVGP